MTRRTLLAAAFQPADPTPLLDDPRFARGLKVWSPEPGAHREQGAIAPAGAQGAPLWGLAQWHSRFTLAGAKAEDLPSGERRYFDGAKSVAFGAEGGFDLALSLDGATEYQGRAPQPGDPWPHLLVERRLATQPRVGALAAVPFHIAYRLTRSNAAHPSGFDQRRHTAQFLLYITVQNAVRGSKGYGDYLWFGVPMYDARYPLPRRYVAPDIGSPKKKGTGKFIFCAGGESFGARPARVGEWNSIEADLLPLMREALEAAWKAGYLPDSHDRNDYHLAGLNCGWEVTGTLDVAMEIRGLRLEGR